MPVSSRGSEPVEGTRTGVCRGAPTRHPREWHAGMPRAPRASSCGLRRQGRRPGHPGGRTSRSPSRWGGYSASSQPGDERRPRASVTRSCARPRRRRRALLTSPLHSHHHRKEQHHEEEGPRLGPDHGRPRGRRYTTLPAAPASAAQGTRSLATVLAADGNRFDRNWNDFDILDRAVRTVLKAKPDSAVGVLADGSTAADGVPAHGPRVHPTRARPDRRARAYRAGHLRAPRQGRRRGHDRAGAALPRGARDHDRAGQARRRRGTGGRPPGLPIKVNAPRKEGLALLQDRDFNDKNALVKPSRLKNINQGNRQIAHGIEPRVLRPANL